MFTLILIGLFALSALLGLIATILSKRRMEQGLGRRVRKLEANSISNWIEVAENKERNG